ncbi:FimD/PapC C-terminal domain-containing protein [Providencia manganoxydans]
MALLRLSDNSFPPFGAQVFNIKGQQVGMVGDDGSTYLTGLNPNDKLQVHWDDKAQCEITLPKILPKSDTLLTNWLLPCDATGILPIEQTQIVVESNTASLPSLSTPHSLISEVSDKSGLASSPSWLRK